MRHVNYDNFLNNISWLIYNYTYLKEVYRHRILTLHQESATIWLINVLFYKLKHKGAVSNEQELEFSQRTKVI